MNNDIFTAITQLKQHQRKAALCIVVNTKGSTPRKIGSKMLVYENKEIIGTVGGGSVEYEVIKRAVEAIKQNKSNFSSFNLQADLNMTCGGLVEVYIEPLGINPNLYIFGAGHIGRKLADLAHNVGFEVTIIDCRAEMFSQFDTAKFRVISKELPQAFDDLTFDNNTFITAVTHTHDFDRQVVAHCAKKTFAYLGMIASKSKIEKTKAIFFENNILTPEEFAKIDTPMGVPIACETPDEIVISILARLIDVKNKLNTQ